ncbi:MAG: cell division protein ZapA [Methylobacterium sp.]|nr:cell division protein ZapA [Methylobacterium sp.]MCA3603802.1 cell division protein ZapA [Methylobacterium sp.]MCA3615322.1 cell division protein ZapA [Methylobacterium sp.]MCA3623860.1 cell division protein ZapA [Methylobacterium sp.]MCA4910594.1 cell division protein ZapA [Methylobacterium sp.]
MAQISVTIDGKQFRMACEDGQEAHLLALAADVDHRIKAMRQNFGDIGDLRLAVMASLMLADEASEERRKANAAAEAVAASRAAVQNASQLGNRREAEIAQAITSLSERVERIARALSGEERDNP